MLGRIIALIVKEIYAILRDKKSRIVLIVPPLVQLFVFAFAATLDVKNVSLGVLNLDNGKESVELIQRLQGSPIFTHIYYLQSALQIPAFIDNQQAVAVLSIDATFSRNLYTGHQADIQIIADGRKSNTAQIVTGYIEEIVRQYYADFAEQHAVPLQSTELIARNWYNPNLIYMWFTVPNLCGVLTFLLALILTSLSIARERELGTFDQLLVSPIEPVEILIGKMVPSILISMAEGSIVVFAAVFIFQIPLNGSLLALYFSMFVFVCSVVGVGLFVSAFCSTQQQAILGSGLIMTPAIALSGFATPVENMPAWLQTLTLANPLRHFLVVLKGIFLKSMPFEIVWSNTWPMALIAVFTLSVATWLFRHRLT